MPKVDFIEDLQEPFVLGGSSTKDNTLDEQIEKMLDEIIDNCSPNAIRQFIKDNYTHNSKVKQSNNRARLDELEKMSHINFIATTTVPRTSSDNRPPVTRMSEHILDRIKELQTILNKEGK